MDSTLVPPHTLPPSSLLNNTNGSLTPGATGPAGPAGLSAASSAQNSIMGLTYDNTTNYDFFDPQHWMLDGLLDFNYSFVAPLEGA